MVAVSALRVSEPLVAFVPLQPPPAVQAVALVEDHESSVEPPLATVVGLADRVTLGGEACVTVTFTDCVADPPAPVQVRANAELAVSAPVEAEPDGSRAPLQLPDAVQDAALVDVQVSVAADPDATDAGVAASVTVGTGGTVGGWVTVAVTVWPAVPPVPEHVSVYSVVLARAPVASLPLVPLVPLHPPEATQAVALFDDQARLADADCWMLLGATASDTEGAGVGAGAGVEGVDGVAVEGESPPPPQPINTAATTGNALRNSIDEAIRITSNGIRR